MDETTTLTLTNDELECVRKFLTEVRDRANPRTTEPFYPTIERVLDKIYAEVYPVSPWEVEVYA
jgi:hypothetical protein